jgi:hypothetical protein
MPGYAAWLYFPHLGAGNAVTLVVEAVEWVPVPSAVPHKSLSYPSYKRACKDRAHAIVSCRLTNRNAYAVRVVPALALLEDGKLVGFMRGGRAQTIPVRGGTMRFDRDLAAKALDWSLERHDRVWRPWWWYTPDQPFAD